MNPLSHYGVTLAPDGSVLITDNRTGGRIYANSYENAATMVREKQAMEEKFNWISDIYTSAEKAEVPRPKRILHTNIEDAVDAVDLATKISKTMGFPCEAQFNDKSGIWFVIES